MTDINEVWVWDVDYGLIDRDRAWIDISYKDSTTEEAIFWHAADPAKNDGQLVYSVTEARFRKLRQYDYFPSNHSLPVVTSSLREVIESTCNPGEVAFHPCEIRSKGRVVLEAWNLYPLSRVECIDRSASDADWNTFFQDEPRLGPARRVVFRPDCLGQSNVARLAESPQWIVVSNALKSAVENHNPRGISFVSPAASRVGKDMASTIQYD